MARGIGVRVPQGTIRHKPIPEAGGLQEIDEYGICTMAVPPPSRPIESAVCLLGLHRAVRRLRYWRNLFNLTRWVSHIQCLAE